MSSAYTIKLNVINEVIKPHSLKATVICNKTGVEFNSSDTIMSDTCPTAKPGGQIM
jgi:hypothetical protein